MKDCVVPCNIKLYDVIGMNHKQTNQMFKVVDCSKNLVKKLLT